MMTTDRTLEAAAANASGRIQNMADQVKALRCLRWIDAWSNGRHAEAPPRPAFVQDFERKHGPLPGSAEILLRRSVPPVAGRVGTGPRHPANVIA